MPSPRSRRINNLCAGGMVACALLLMACEKEEKQAAPPPLPAVSVVEVATQNVPIVMEFSGTLKAIRRVEVVPRVTGYIVSRSFTEGAFVKKGDLLYQIDPRPYQETLDQNKAELKIAQAGLKFWESEAERYERLVKSGAVSQEKLEGTIASRDEYRAKIEQYKANISAAELDLSFTEISAPMDGKIQQTKVFEGANVTEQKDVLTEVVLLDPINVIFNVTRRESYDIQELKAAGTGYPVDKMIVQVRLPDESVYPATGKIDFISARINPTTDSSIVRGILENKVDEKIGMSFLPGQYVPVLVTVGALPNALVIPRVALVQTQAGTFVYVVGLDNKIERRKIELGRVHHNLRVVTKGLQKGEKIVVDGLQKIKDGMTIKVKSEQKNGAQPS